ncbi:hypothetical protein BDK51DRAFT_27157 [Blyttiomyces helicus]|uniref:F-box domain-containing protein n=1 Tax=Blyttiomyces helicus TaxID=388810 RepID=A0A4P9WDQ6_9FUNG|nr:hypothetical protein BDK51DRAFT_27157 [Blyttiomyces helicus]|eukprot:RKO90839.1 hypothetical protein BDK51DRAFT_27157 [Blyttiomyces helicus]
MLPPNDLITLHATSKRLAKVSKDKSLQRTLSLSSPPNSARLTLSTVQQHLRRRKKHLREVDFTGVWWLTAGKVADAVGRCKALVSVRLDGHMWLGLKALLHLGTELPTLERLLAGVELDSSSPTVEGTRPWCPRVTVLELTVRGYSFLRGCAHLVGVPGSVAAVRRFSILVRDMGVAGREMAPLIAQFVERMPALVSLRTMNSYPTIIRPAGFGDGSGSDLPPAISMKHIDRPYEELYLQACFFQVGNPVIAAVFRTWGATLRVLVFNVCDSPTRSHLILLLETCPRIETLTVSDCPCMKDPDVLDIIREHRNVKHVDVRLVHLLLGDSTAAEPDAPSLRLTPDPPPGPTGFNTLKLTLFTRDPIIADPGVHPSLTTLYLIAEKLPFTDEDLDALLLAAPLLEHVTLIFGPQNAMTDAGLERALTSWKPRLRTFHLHSAPAMSTGSGLLPLGRCLNLRDLQLSRIGRVDTAQTLSPILPALVQSLAEIPPPFHLHTFVVVQPYIRVTHAAGTALVALLANARELTTLTIVGEGAHWDAEVILQVWEASRGLMHFDCCLDERAGVLKDVTKRAAKVFDRPQAAKHFSCIRTAEAGSSFVRQGGQSRGKGYCQLDDPKEMWD